MNTISKDELKVTDFTSPKDVDSPCSFYPCCRCYQCCIWHSSPELIVLLEVGSFNPTTMMHLRMMELARDAVNRSWSFNQSALGGASVGHSGGGQMLSFNAHDKCQTNIASPRRRQVVVAGILSPVSDAYAKALLQPAYTRCRLARLACATMSNWLAVDAWEAKQSQWIRTRVVVEHLQARLNNLAKLSPKEIQSLMAATECNTESDSAVSESCPCAFPIREQSQIEFFTRLWLDDMHPALAKKSVRKSADYHLAQSVDECPGMATNAWLCARLLEAQNISACPDLVSRQEKTCTCPQKTKRMHDMHLKTEEESKTQLILPRARVKLVCGADLLESFATPGVWTEGDITILARDYGIICISRPNSSAARLLSEMDLLSRYEQNILLVDEWCRNELSATLVRRALARGQSVRYLIPDAVLEEIYSYGLYGTGLHPREQNIFASQPHKQCNRSETSKTERLRHSTSLPPQIQTTNTKQELRHQHSPRE